MHLLERVPHACGRIEWHFECRVSAVVFQVSGDHGTNSLSLTVPQSSDCFVPHAIRSLANSLSVGLVQCDLERCLTSDCLIRKANPVGGQNSGQRVYEHTLHSQLI